MQKRLILGYSLRNIISDPYTTLQREANAEPAWNALRGRYWRSLAKSGGRRWWEGFPLAQAISTSIKSNVTCDASFGSPSLANCASILFELIGSGPVVLDPVAGPLLRKSGNCAIGIESSIHQSTTWGAIRVVVEHLLSTCVRNPVTGAIGGFAISHAARSGKPVRRSEDSDAQASGFTVSMFLQEPFNGMPVDTCAWKVVSSRTGDVRQCPVPASIWRPPARRIGQNGTESNGQWGGNETLFNGGTQINTTVAANITA